MVSQMIGPGSGAHNYHRSVVISTFWVYTSCDSYYNVSRLIPDTNPASNLYFLLTGCVIMAYLVEFSAITKILLTSREITKKITKNFHYYQKSLVTLLFCQILINKFHKNNPHIVCFRNINTINFILIQGKQG
jgi:hypothetical protein